MEKMRSKNIKRFTLLNFYSNISLMKITKFFDKLEDKIRRKLSQYPVIYAFIGSIGIILLWRGVWLTADQFAFMTGPVSMAIGVIILLLIGLFVSFFVGEQIIISGLKEEKRLDEKTEREVRREEITLREIKRELEEIKERLKKL